MSNLDLEFVEVSNLSFTNKVARMLKTNEYAVSQDTIYVKDTPIIVAYIVKCGRFDGEQKFYLREDFANYGIYGIVDCY